MSCYWSKIKLIGTVLTADMGKKSIKIDDRSCNKAYELVMHSVQALCRQWKLGGAGVEIRG